jgi:hypothetical protein
MFIITLLIFYPDICQFSEENLSGWNAGKIGAQIAALGLPTTISMDITQASWGRMWSHFGGISCNPELVFRPLTDNGIIPRADVKGN